MLTTTVSELFRLFISTAGIKGDINLDGDISVVDIVRLVNIILEGNATQYESWAGDYNNDGNQSILDIIQIVNYILGIPLAKTTPNSGADAWIYISPTSLSVKSDIPIAGIQFTTYALADNEISFATLPLERYEKIADGEMQSLLFSPSGQTLNSERHNIFTTPDGFKLENILLADARGQEIGVLIREVPDEYKLFQNYPNPFNPMTTIKFGLPEEAQVKLVVYDLLGHQVKTWRRQFYQPGYHQVTWDATNDRGRNVASGIYFIRIAAGQYHKVEKMMLLR